MKGPGDVSERHRRVLSRPTPDSRLPSHLPHRRPAALVVLEEGLRALALRALELADPFALLVEHPVHQPAQLVAVEVPLPLGRELLLAGEARIDRDEPYAPQC